MWGASAALLGLLGVAAVLLPISGRHELRQTFPLIDLRVSARPVVL